MLLQLAWKNIWRNKVRSMIVVVAIMLGIWAGAFVLSYVFGMIDQRLEDAIKSEISHIQLHHPKFPIDNEPVYSIASGQLILDNIKQDDRIKAVSGRSIAIGMVNSATISSGGEFVGIHPEDEHKLTGLKEMIIEGEYLDNDDKNKILIGQKLAEKLKVKLRSKVVLTFQDTEGTIVAGAFRIKGIYSIHNSSIEDRNIYTNTRDLNALLSSKEPFHEIALLMNDAETIEPFVDEMRLNYTELLIEDWGDLAPELSLMIESLDQYMIIFLIIILLALSFGIVNTMLMSVLERVREIGMLMAIGMNKVRLFSMIGLETVFMVMIATPFGLLLAFITIEYLGTYGLDLSGIYQEGYAAYGFRSFVYPTLETSYYFRILGLVVLMALLSSIYPALTALRLDPVKAIRKI